MRKLIKMSRVAFAFKTLVLVLLGFCSSFAQIPTGCYEIRPASNSNKRLTNVGGVLKMQNANNSDSQIFHIVSHGSGKISIMAQGSNQGFLAAANFNIGTPIYLKTTAEFPSSVEIYNNLGVPFWNSVIVNDANPGTKYNMTKFNDTGTTLPVVGFGASNWGEGDPNSTATDIYLTSANDMAIFGGAKWYVTTKVCPSNFCDFNFTATVSNFNPVIGSTVLFSANCQGAGCTGVTYHWVPTDARGYGTSRPLTAGFNGQLGPFTMDVIASKPGCTSKTKSVTMNVVSGSSLRMGEEEVITAAEKETTLSPNPSTGEFDVNFFLEKGNKAKLSVVDMNGEVIQEKQLVGKGNHKEKISLSNNSSGTYLVRILRDNGQEVKKAVVIK